MPGFSDSSVMFDDAARLLEPGALSHDEIKSLLNLVGFADIPTAHRRLLEISTDEDSRRALGECLPMLLVALSGTATPDGSLINFERYVGSVSDRGELFRYLASNPRAVEILVKLFVGSQFLTEILLRNPNYLQRLTNHKRIAEFKSRQELIHEAHEAAAAETTIADKLNALRRFQHWELLRIGACDSFGLFDLKSVTVQLSLLADSLVQSCLSLLAEEMEISLDGFAVLAFGKMGGEELNYSSDIDLVFLARADATSFWTLGQKLIKAVMESTGEGFLYRVDMRLRPWGKSGALVNSVDAHCKYLREHGMPWEKQALLKARVVAGDQAVGQEFLNQAQPLVFGLPAETVRETVRDMKERIELELERQGRAWGEVKSGAGSIRDVEFVTQYLQLIHGGADPNVRSINTLDGLVRLADLGYLQADEFRQLSDGYMFLRTIEHSLQLMHYKQTHALPEEKRELKYLARRLDYPDAENFLSSYRAHRDAIRRIYEKYIGGEEPPIEIPRADVDDGMPRHVAHMDASYAEIFSEEEIVRHAQLLDALSDENLVELDAIDYGDGKCRLTIVGHDDRGDLSRVCGLLFVHGFNIADGHTFAAEEVGGRAVIKSGTSIPGRGQPKTSAKWFINVFTLLTSPVAVLDEIWPQYERELVELLKLVRAGRRRDAQGELAKRVGGALRNADVSPTLYPVDVEIDNEASERSTVLHIRADDTIGFLFELTNALALARIDINRLIVTSVGRRALDTLYVTDSDGRKLSDPARQQELRAAVVLIKHFSHLLPRSPKPHAALLHFSDFLEQLFKRPNWPEEFASLEQSDVLDAIARLLGVSDFLWEDFLRLQHENLFPVVKDIDALKHPKLKADLETELREELAAADDAQQAAKLLNAFKDREMFRADMRHILGHVTEFGEFSAELTDVAEVVIGAASGICLQKLTNRYGTPLQKDQTPCPFTVVALGKCGGRELGFASDVELMFIYREDGSTSGPDVITTAEFYQKLVEAFQRTIQTRQEGVFQVDLRLRPYGRAGSLAVSLDAFASYFAAEGAAWPYERQALVKLRPIFGDEEFGARIVRLRDELVYAGEPFDVAAMRAMREKQVRQLVKAGTLNAKLSPGGLVDCEYLVQGLQITNGHRHPSLRETNTLSAMKRLAAAEILSLASFEQLSQAYVFQRRLIDALRMVRGHAKDLTVPAPETEEFLYLARRLGDNRDVTQLKGELETHFAHVRELNQRLDDLSSQQ
ncbi:MAG: glutamine synthetase adenylyltransferase [Planctomycetaceae bacterium]|jgi:[glutamine synthetase] adenylyltransferase / [glutamine synthetase]-adenylyl-L-tyrosine phosphorylase|nr:glutamine synthetase adenylyltransferase [Planctomycetaceae bacterium]MBT6153548.1 glutamine synthetase adenylyltransferase [Planctomycetaceae bacterium]MBT6483071.1 glutamine synthetase adenylyltransferase [Planctomycetaceae bacterium]MBT6495380.1 glutamine synthetase adenylyltransferase [Planctomycetaceae bacterium]